MADYLSSIVARASQAAPSLSPRVPSLFEPPAALLSVPLPMPMSARRQTSSPAGRDRIPTLDARVSEPQAPAVALPDVSTKPVQQQAFELDVTVDTHDGAAKEETPTPGPPRRRPVPSSKVQREPEPTLEFAEHETDDTIQPLVARARPHAASPLPAMLEPAPIGHPPAQANAPENPAPAIAPPRTEPSVRDVAQAVQTINVTPSPQRPTEAMRQAPKAVAPPPLEMETQRPVVNVVIERLSVQAITSATVPARPSAPPPPPAMSLEQYLQRRSTRS